MIEKAQGFDTCSGVENIWVEPGEAQSLLCRVQGGASHHDLGDAWVSGIGMIRLDHREA